MIQWQNALWGHVLLPVQKIPSRAIIGRELLFV